MKAPTKEQLLADVLSNATWNEIAQKYGYSDPRFLRKLARRYDLPKRRAILKPSEQALRRMIQEEGLTPYRIADPAAGRTSTLTAGNMGSRSIFRPIMPCDPSPLPSGKKKLPSALFWGTLTCVLPRGKLHTRFPLPTGKSKRLIWSGSCPSLKTSSQQKSFLPEKLTSTGTHPHIPFPRSHIPTSENCTHCATPMERRP